MSLPVPVHLTDFLAQSPRPFVTLFQTASRTAAVEIMFISAAQKWSLFRGCRWGELFFISGKADLREKFLVVSRSQPARPRVFWWVVFFCGGWWIDHIWDLVDCLHLGGLFHFGCCIWGLMDPLVVRWFVWAFSRSFLIGGFGVTLFFCPSFSFSYFLFFFTNKGCCS